MAIVKRRKRPVFGVDRDPAAAASWANQDIDPIDDLIDALDRGDGWAVDEWMGRARADGTAVYDAASNRAIRDDAKLVVRRTQLPAYDPDADGYEADTDEGDPRLQAESLLESGTDRTRIDQIRSGSPPSDDEVRSMQLAWLEEVLSGVVDAYDVHPTATLLTVADPAGREAVLVFFALGYSFRFLGWEVVGAWKTEAEAWAAIKDIAFVDASDL
jgi:hypothetical protein